MRLGATTEDRCLLSALELEKYVRHEVTVVKEIIREIPISDIADVTFEKGKLDDKIGLVFSDEKRLELESIKVDKGESFVAAVKDNIAQN